MVAHRRQGVDRSGLGLGHAFELQAQVRCSITLRRRILTCTHHTHPAAHTAKGSVASTLYCVAFCLGLPIRLASPLLLSSWHWQLLPIVANKTSLVELYLPAYCESRALEDHKKARQASKCGFF